MWYGMPCTSVPCSISVSPVTSSDELSSCTVASISRWCVLLVCHVSLNVSMYLSYILIRQSRCVVYKLALVVVHGVGVSVVTRGSSVVASPLRVLVEVGVVGVGGGSVVAPLCGICSISKAGATPSDFCTLVLPALLIPYLSAIMAILACLGTCIICLGACST